MDTSVLTPRNVTPIGSRCGAVRLLRPQLGNAFLTGRRLTQCNSIIISKGQRKRDSTVTCSSSQKLQVRMMTDVVSQNWKTSLKGTSVTVLKAHPHLGVKS